MDTDLSDFLSNSWNDKFKSTTVAAADQLHSAATPPHPHTSCSTPLRSPPVASAGHSNTSPAHPSHGPTHVGQTTNAPPPTHGRTFLDDLNHHWRYGHNAMATTGSNTPTPPLHMHSPTHLPPSANRFGPDAKSNDVELFAFPMASASRHKDGHQRAGPSIANFPNMCPVPGGSRDMVHQQHQQHSQQHQHQQLQQHQLHVQHNHHHQQQQHHHLQHIAIVHGQEQVDSSTPPSTAALGGHASSSSSGSSVSSLSSVLASVVTSNDADKKAANSIRGTRGCVTNWTVDRMDNGYFK